MKSMGDCANSGRSSYPGEGIDMGVRPPKNAGKLRKIAKNCRKMRKNAGEIAENCGKIMKIAKNCEKLRKIDTKAPMFFL